MDPTKTNAYLNSLFENSPEAIVLLDKHNRVLRANPEFYRLFGYSETEIERKHIDALITSPAEYSEASDFSTRAENGEHLSAESTRRRKDGAPVEVSILGAPIEVDGQVVGIFGIYRDISDRKQVEHELAMSEQKHRKLFEDAPIGIFQSSSSGRFLSVNESAAEMFGFEDPLGLIGAHSDIGQSLYYRPERRAEFLQQLMKDGEVKNFELRARRKDGSVIWVSLNARLAYWQPDGTFIIDGFITDMTRLKQTAEKLETSLRDKEVLLQELHHRVKNNMQIISSLLNLEAMNIEKPQTRELLHVIQNRIQAMSLVHEKLYGSEHIEVVDLAEYTHDLCLQVLDVISKRYSIEFRFDLQSIFAGIDFSVPYGLIVNELVMNAYKHAFNGVDDPQIEVSLHKNGQDIVLIFRDNGVGLPTGFDMEESPTLGMKLINSLIGQLNGTFSHTADQGTTWKIVFPGEVKSTG
ncbi:MAG: sensor histidine kinase [Spirochaetota bacterium]